tara:strand:+ start:968 stop:1207 length:240 start_codon:yes stop_codon:yes gene_type:complete
MSSPNPDTNDDTLEAVGHGLLTNCVKTGDDANSKLAQKTLDNANNVGVKAAFEEMAKDCFKHPENGRQLSYCEMRMYYG